MTAAQQDELLAALDGPAPQHDRWNGRTVAEWIAHHLARAVCRQLGWGYLRHLGARLRVPRPRHVHVDPQAHADFKRRLRPLLRAVATAFPHANAELWAVDEHRIGPEANPAQGLDITWLPPHRSLPCIGTTGAISWASCTLPRGAPCGIWRRPSTPPLFSVELDAFAHAVRASPIKQIVLVLDGAGWHDSPKVRVPEHVHLLFLPPHSPELQPAEHL